MIAFCILRHSSTISLKFVIMRVLKEIDVYKKKNDPSRKEIINAMELLTHYIVPMFTGNNFSTFFLIEQNLRDR